MRYFAVVLIASLFTIATASAEVYKWVDAEGKVHYGDKPKKEKAEEVLKKVGDLPDTPEDPAIAKAAAERAANCEDKKKKLEHFKKSTVISETDGLGNTREYSTEEKERFIALTEKQTAEACAPAPSPTPSN